MRTFPVGLKKNKLSKGSQMEATIIVHLFTSKLEQRKQVTKQNSLEILLFLCTMKVK